MEARVARIVSHVLDKIEDELKVQGITKRAFAASLNRDESWLHGIFAERRELKADDLFAMLRVLKVSCDLLLPEDVANELRGMTLETYIERLVGRKVAEIASGNGEKKGDKR